MKTDAAKKGGRAMNRLEIERPIYPERRGWYREVALFLRSAVRRYRDCGMPFPSSRAVARKIISMIPIHQMERIVEVGAGTGRLTQEIIRRMNGAELICVEKIPEFCDYLRETFRDQRVSILNTPVEELLAHYPEMARKKADCIILSLPARLVAPELRAKWIEICHVLLKDGGQLVVQQFVPVFEPYLRKPAWQVHRRQWMLDFPPFRADVFRKQPRDIVSLS